MGVTNISWTARRRTVPLPADTLVTCARGAPCLDTDCKHCWVKGHTTNPWIGCVEKTEACANCYAKGMATNRMGLDVWGKNKDRQVRTKEAIRDLLRIHRRSVRTGQREASFTGSMCDIFEDREDLVEPRRQYLEAAAHATGVDLMLLTKRGENIWRMVPPAWKVSWPKHIWAGVTIASPGEESFADVLASLKIKGATTFVSVEPMLGTGPRRGNWLRSVDLCIVGGESGPGARSFDEDAARELVEACYVYETFVWFKQMGSRWAERMGHHLIKGASHGQDVYRLPQWARRRELPPS